MLVALARGGAGNTHFAEHRDAAGAAVAAEVEELLAQVVSAVTLTVRPSTAVHQVRLLNDLPVSQRTTEELVAELGAFYEGEHRRLLLSMHVGEPLTLGPSAVCDLEFAWVDINSLETQTVIVPVSVNVVPGDAAAGRVPNAVVRTERACLAVQQDKQAAVSALHRGDAVTAAHTYQTAAARLGDLGILMDPTAARELREEQQLLSDLARNATTGDVRRTAKLTEADRHTKERRVATANPTTPPPATGDRNSKRTRVDPVFAWLETQARDDWANDLLRLADGLHPTRDPGRVLSSEWHTERQVPASASRLAWMLRNHHLLVPTDGRKARALQRRLSNTEEVCAAIDQLEQTATSKGVASHLLLEGPSHADCLIECENMIIWVEGKRDDWLAPGTTWDVTRDQLARNLEAAWRVAAETNRDYCLLICHEESLKHHERALINGYRTQTWAAGWPHVPEGPTQCVRHSHRDTNVEGHRRPLAGPHSPVSGSLPMHRLAVATSRAAEYRPAAWRARRDDRARRRAT